MNTNTTEKKSEQVAETLVGLGRDWASYGLRMAKMALEQSAGTLEKVASALDGIREQVETAGKAAAPAEKQPVADKQPTAEKKADTAPAAETPRGANADQTGQ